MTETLEQHYHNHPCIVAMWHGQFMLLPLIKPPFIPVDIMLARHRDAEILAETLRHFDMQLIRGAGAASTWPGPRWCACVHGGRAGATRDGRTVAMTADVPGGKARSAGPGIVIGRAAIRVPDPAGRHRHLALSGLQYLEPHDG